MEGQSLSEQKQDRSRLRAGGVGGADRRRGGRGNAFGCKTNNKLNKKTFKKISTYF